MTRYRVLHPLRYPTDPAVIARLQAGENLRLIDRAMKEVMVGQVVDDIPQISVRGLLRKKYIEELPDQTRPRPVYKPAPERTEQPASRQREEVSDASPGES